MTTLAVRHRVRDYDSWKPIFDEHEAVRRQHGSAGHRLYRMADNANDLAISIEFPSPQAAQAFLEDPSLRPTMERAGVQGEPQIAILEQVETRSYEPAVA